MVPAPPATHICDNLLKHLFLAPASYTGFKDFAVVTDVKILRNQLYFSNQHMLIIHFCMSSRPSVESTQPPIWVLGALSQRVKRPGREADHSSPTSNEVKKT
jgi:hypothetical protein